MFNIFLHKRSPKSGGCSIGNCYLLEDSIRVGTHERGFTELLNVIFSKRQHRIEESGFLFRSTWEFGNDLEFRL